MLGVSLNRPQACENHEKIVEGLSEGLCAISEHVVECKADQALFQTPEMIELIVDLYAHIFVFLGSTMDWIMEKRYKRMLDSFNESFSKRFDSEVGAIKRRAERIRNLAAQSSRAEARVTRVILEDMYRDVRVGLVAGARQQAEMQYRMQRLEEEMAEMTRAREQSDQAWRQLANLAKLMLQDNAMGWLSANREVTHGIPITLVADTSFRVGQISQGRLIIRLSTCAHLLPGPTVVFSVVSKKNILTSYRRNEGLESRRHRGELAWPGGFLLPQSRPSL